MSHTADGKGAIQTLGAMLAQHRALDAGFETPTGWETCIDHEDYPHLAPRRPEDRPPPPDPP